MTEQIEGVFSAEVDTKHHRIVRKGPLGAETSAVPPEPINVIWRASGHGRLIREHPSSGALDDKVINELKNDLYEFKDDQVESFLEENPALADLLYQAHKMIPEFFGPEVKMALEVVADPEALGDKQLFVLIRTDLPRREARQHLSDLDQAWWLSALPAAEGKMEIALE
jgi:hypothetical protein